jgi:lysophospholipase L1-like esterase
MKRILCYGDSNTYGFTPKTGDRFDEKTRWTKLLEKDLGSGYEVIEDGFNGRTTVFDDPGVEGRNGKESLVPGLKDNRPLDLVILMLGTNDIKPLFARCAKDIADGIETLVRIILDPETHEGLPAPEILVVSPIEVRESIVDSCYSDGFGLLKAVAMSKELPPLVEAVAKRNGCHYIDAAKYAVASDIDAIHLDEKGHASLARAFAGQVRLIF